MRVNQRIKISYLAFYIMVLIASCTSANQGHLKLIDDQATEETSNLYQNLNRLADKGIMFGHEDAMAYGISWNGEENRSDVKDVVGTHPAVHGYDLGQISSSSYNLDSVPFERMVTMIKDVYSRGGINTISWHMYNPATNGGSWDKDSVVKDMLPGGKYHEVFKGKLDKAAEFFSQLKSGNTFIPIIFRPFHEHNGDWFWWGKGNCSEEDYIQLWKFTVDYLKNTRQVHHLIYAFSPDRSRLNLTEAEKEYYYGYPGDDYVDIIGLDNYIDVRPGEENSQKEIDDYTTSLQLITKIAEEKQKIAALTETGLEKIPVPDWFTSRLLKPIKKSSQPIRISYILVWRNASTEHHFGPFPGHPSEQDFKKFYKDKMTLFENDLKNMYKSK